MHYSNPSPLPFQPDLESHSLVSAMDHSGSTQNPSYALSTDLLHHTKLEPEEDLLAAHDSFVDFDMISEAGVSAIWEGRAEKASSDENTQHGQGGLDFGGLGDVDLKQSEIKKASPSHNYRRPKTTESTRSSSTTASRVVDSKPFHRRGMARDEEGLRDDDIEGSSNDEDVLDDAITVDTRLSAHSSYSLARRAKLLIKERKETRIKSEWDAPSIDERSVRAEPEAGRSRSSTTSHSRNATKPSKPKRTVPLQSLKPFSVPPPPPGSSHGSITSTSASSSTAAKPITQFLNRMQRPRSLANPPGSSSSYRNISTAASANSTNFSGSGIDDGSDDEQHHNLPKGAQDRQTVQKRPPESLSTGRQVQFDSATKPGTLSTAGDINTSDGADECILAVNCKGRKIGAAYYNMGNGRLYLMEDVEESEHYEITKLLRFQVQPSVIVTSARADDAFLDALSAPDEALRASTVDVRPSTDFSYDAAKSRLLSTQLFAEEQGPELYVDPSEHLLRQRETFLYLGTKVSMNCREMVGCAGALLNYISKAKMTGAMEEGDDGEEVAGVEQFNLTMYMHVNADSMWSLQIFQQEAHPNRQSNRGKEGLSLFGILNTTKTPLGKSLLHSWFLRPLLDMDEITDRHASVGFFLQPEIRDVGQKCRQALKHIKNTPKILRKLQTNPTVADWQAILKFTYYALRIRAILHEFEPRNPIPILPKVHDTFSVQDLKTIGTYINHVVDFDESVHEGRVVVKPQVDDELDELKRTYAGLDDLLSEVAREVSATIPDRFSMALNVIYFPQLGYLIALPLSDELSEQNDMAVDGLYFQFCTENRIYYKSDRMFGQRINISPDIVRNCFELVELDETVGDVHSMIVDREIEIMQRLQETVIRYRTLLESVGWVIAELDCILSLSEAARVYGYQRPVMVPENVIEIKKGRHPLLELVVDAFIPNDTSLGSDAEDPARMILLTGANCSGKSVLLKQTALIVYMAQIGSYVPCASARLGIVDKIFTRVTTRESVSNVQSTFMMDLQQVAVALGGATGRSVVVLDEFGKGTVPADGAGLLASVLEEFASRGENCPKLLAATHFHELYTYDLVSIPRPFLKECTMEILEAKNEGGVTYLYRIIPGRSEKSFGVHCAALAGMRPDIVQRGHEASEAIQKGYPLPPLETPRSKRRAEAAELVADFFVDFDCENGDLDELWRVLDEHKADFTG